MILVQNISIVLEFNRTIADVRESYISAMDDSKTREGEKAKQRQLN